MHQRVNCWIERDAVALFWKVFACIHAFIVLDELLFCHFVLHVGAVDVRV